jgi:uncharacterized protein YycO
MPKIKFLSTFNVLFYSIIVYLSSCYDNNKIHKSIMEGDLLFQDLNCGDLCDAIEAVTEGVNGKDFSHCAMIIKIEDSLMVIEAVGKGVKLTNLNTFLKRSNDTNRLRNVTFARLKPQFHHLIPEALKFAKNQIGKPYDKAFLLNNESFYCSELLHESFKSANHGKDFFSLTPMTFKSPKTDSFFPAWISYYKDLGIAIPEGELGLNPGSISRSDKIDVLEINYLNR